MAMDMLRQLAGSRLPATFYTESEIDQVKLLRAAGLVIALTPAPSDPLTFSGCTRAAQVLAITQKGREELARFSFPDSEPRFSQAVPSRWRSKIQSALRSRAM